MDPFTAFAGALSAAGVRYLVIGVGELLRAGRQRNVHDPRREFFLPADSDNLFEAWRVCETNGFRLFMGSEPFDETHDGAFARTVVGRLAFTCASDGAATDVDLSLVISGFDFEEVWSARRSLEVEGVAIPVAKVSHIVASEATAGREKDRLFLATHREALQHLLSDDETNS